MRPFLPQFFSDLGGSGQSRPVDSVLMISQALGERRLPSTRQVTPGQQRAPQKWQLSPKRALLLLSHLPIQPGGDFVPVVQMRKLRLAEGQSLCPSIYLLMAFPGSDLTSK